MRSRPIVPAADVVRITLASVLLACGDAGGGDPQANTSAPGGTEAGEEASSTASDPAGSSSAAGSESSNGTGSSSTDAGESSGEPGEPHVPDGVLFFDGFDYVVDREDPDKFGDAAEFRAHGWSWGKDAVQNGPGAGGWLHTSPEVPGDTAGLPGLRFDARPVRRSEGRHLRRWDRWRVAADRLLPAVRRRRDGAARRDSGRRVHRRLRDRARRPRRRCGRGRPAAVPVNHCSGLKPISRS